MQEGYGEQQRPAYGTAEAFAGSCSLERFGEHEMLPRLSVRARLEAQARRAAKAEAELVIKITKSTREVLESGSIPGIKIGKNAKL